MTYSIPGLHAVFSGDYPVESLKKVAYGLMVLGLVLFLVSSMRTPKFDAKMEEVLRKYPTKEISVLVICKGACPRDLEGREIAPGRIIAVGRARDFLKYKNAKEVVQIRFLGFMPS